MNIHLLLASLDQSRVRFYKFSFLVSDNRDLILKKYNEAHLTTFITSQHCYFKLATATFIMQGLDANQIISILLTHCKNLETLLSMKKPGKKAYREPLERKE